MTKTGSGGLFLIGANTYSGGTVLSQGSLAIRNASALGTGPLSTNSGTLLDIVGISLITNSITLNGSTTFNTGGPPSTLSGTISGTGPLVKSGPGTLVLSGSNTYSGGTTLSTGNITLLNSEALGTGPISMTVGTTLGLGSSSPSNPIILNGSSTLSTASSGSVLGSISGTGSFIKNGVGRLTLSAENSYSGGTTIFAGTLDVQNNNALGSGSLTINNGTTFAIGSGINISNSASIASAGTGTFNVSSGIATFSGSLSNTSGSLLKTGNATLSLSGVNSHSGGTTISEGTLDVENNSALGSGALTINNGTTLAIGSGININNSASITSAGNGTFNVSSGVGTFSGSLSNTSGSLVKTGNATLSLSGVNSHSGGTTISEGTLDVENNSALGSGALTINNGTTLAIGSGININNLASIASSGTGTFNVSSGVGTFSGSLSNTSGSLIKTGNGTLVFTGNNQYFGGTAVEEGTLSLSGSGQILPSGALTLNGNSTFDISAVSSSITVGDLTTSSESTLSLGSKEFTFGTNTDTSLAGSITGSNATLTKQGSGTATLSGSSTFTGDTYLSEGELFLESSSSLGSSILNIENETTLSLDSGITISNGAFLTGNANLNVLTGLAKYSGIIAGSGNLIKTGPGILQITGFNSYTGSTTVSEGNFQVNGSIPTDLTVQTNATLSGTGTIFGNVETNGTIAPGNSPGTLQVNGNVDFQCKSELFIAVDNTSNSALQVAGDVTIASNCPTHLTFYALPSYLQSEQTFTFLTANSITGEFSEITANSPLFIPVVTYSNGMIQAKLNVGFNSAFTDSNAKKVGEVVILLAKDPNTGFDAVLASLIALPTVSDVESALNDMQPALYKGLTISQENNAVKIQDTLSHRFEQGLNEVHCTAFSSECEKKVAVVHAWLDGFGDILNQQSNTYANSAQVGYQAKTGGVSLGIDGHFAKYFYLGALGAYTNSDIKWDESQSNGDIDTGYGGIYFSAISEIFYGNLSVLAGWSHFHATRSISYPDVNLKASNSHGGSQLLSHADTGINLGFKGFTIRPFNSFDYITQTENGFTEQGAGIFNLSVDKKNSIMLRNELGVYFAGCLCLGNSKWTLSPKISWIREVRIKGESFNSKFINTDIPFESIGYFPDRSLVSPGVTLSSSLWKDRLDLNLYYDGEFCSKYSDHSYGGQIRFGF